MKYTLCSFLFIISLTSCSNLKKIHSYKSPNDLKLSIYSDRKEEDTFVFELKNKSTDPIQYSTRFSIYGNMLDFHSPTGVIYQSPDHTGSLFTLESGKSFKIVMKYLDAFLMEAYKAKETGFYKCIWKNERLDFETEFLYYLDYEKAKKKHGLSDR